MTTSTVCIQDKNGKHWNTTCSSAYTDPEIHNMQRHLDAATKHPEMYRFLDLATCRGLVFSWDTLDRQNALLFLSRGIFRFVNETIC
jgi:hypothetical protein